MRQTQAIAQPYRQVAVLVCAVCSLVFAPDGRVLGADWSVATTVERSEPYVRAKPSESRYEPVVKPRTSPIVTGSTTGSAGAGAARQTVPATTARRVTGAGGDVGMDGRQAPAPVAPKSGIVAPPIELAARSADDPAASRSAADEEAKRSTDAVCPIVLDPATQTAIESERRSLRAMAQDVSEKTAVLEQKTEALKAWLQKRELLVRQVNKFVTDTYSRMKADAAAAQLSAMEFAQAGAILSRLDPDKAGAIMSEMDPGKAATILAALNSTVANAGEATIEGN